MKGKERDDEAKPEAHSAEASAACRRARVAAPASRATIITAADNDGTAAQPHATCVHPRELNVDAAMDKILLELDKGPGHMEEHATGRRRGVDGLLVQIP
jgi:hypothetical protein